jgi:hypothetical protein
MARSFNGSTDLITIGSAAVLHPAAMSFSAWVYIAALPGLGVFTSISNNGNYDITIVNSGGSGRLGVIVVATGGNPSFATGSFNLPIGSWFHVAFTYDSTNGIISYINGSAGDTAAANGTLNGTPIATSIGYDGVGGRGHWNGNMADIAIWNTALSSGQISSLVSGIRPPSVQSANLVGYWPLDGYASPEPDLSGNGNNGTLTGTARVLGPPPVIYRISA